MNYTESSRIIKRIRKEHALKQSELTDLLNLKSGQYVSNMERGIAKIPPKYIRFLHDRFGINPVETIEAIIADERKRVIAEYEKSVPGEPPKKKYDRKTAN